MQAFSSCGEQGSLSSCGVQPPRSCGMWAQLPHSLWNRPGPGIEPMLPALAGGFLHTGPPGKSIYSIFNTSSILPEFYIYVYIYMRYTHIHYIYEIYTYLFSIDLFFISSLPFAYFDSLLLCSEYCRLMIISHIQ